MRAPLRVFVVPPLRALSGVLLFAAVTLLSASCSDSNDDDIGDACKVVVDTCHVVASRGDCVDALGALPPDCVACIAEHGCDYATCQRSLTGCRIPEELVPSP